MFEDTGIGPTPFTTRDFELMAAWYGVDAKELIENVQLENELNSLGEDFTHEGWEVIEEAAIELGGCAEKPFDFIEASSRAAALEREGLEISPLSADGLLAPVYGEGIYQELAADDDERQGEPNRASDIVADAAEELRFLASVGTEDVDYSAWSMTNLLGTAFLASYALGPDPTEKELEAYDRVISEVERRCSSSLALDTPIGRLVATTRGTDHDSSYAVSVDLEKPDGTSGQVAMVEVVAGDLSDVYPCPLHTFAWNGEDEDVASCVDCDHNGEMMQETGWVMGEKASSKDGNSPSVAFKDAEKAAKRSIGQKADESALAPSKTPPGISA